MEYMNWKQKWHSALKKITIIESENQVYDFLDTLRENKKSIIISFINTHGMNLIINSDDFYSNLINANFVLRDGIGMSILLKKLNISPGLNMNGTDFIPKFLTELNFKRIALIGTTEPYLTKSADYVSKKVIIPTQIITCNGFENYDKYICLVKNYKPELIILGMGMSKQEHLSIILREKINYPCIIICGGAIIDFMGGKVKRAPKWLRDLNFEWIYRLYQEPKRLFKRYIIGNPIFLIRSFLFKL